MSSDITYWPAVQIGEAVAKRRVSAREVVDAHLRRISQVNSHLNAVIQSCGDRAMSEADQVDSEISKGCYRGPLHGVPMTLKDSLDTEGVLTTWGTLGRKNHVPSRDATLVSRLRQKGAILLGKTNTPELTLAADTDNLIYGRTHNPYDMTLSPGGSSGGAAAIVASGGSAFDIGSDTGGSVRIPSHCCGIAGLKPTSGRVPRTGHCISYDLGASESLTQNGPMARSVDDLFPILQAISGPDFQDPAIVPMTLKDPAKVRIRDLRVAFHTDNGLMSPTKETAEVVKNAAYILKSQGVEVQDKVPSAIGMLKEIDNRNTTGDGRAWVKRILDAAGTTEYSPFMLKRFQDAIPISSSEFTLVLEMLDVYRSQMIKFMGDYDLILCPAGAKPAVGPGECFLPENNFLYSYTSAFNVTGWPAGVVRGGTSDEGLPIAVQVVGRPWREDVVLSVLGLLEKGMGGWVPPCE